MTALGNLPSWQSPLIPGSTAGLDTRAYKFSTGTLIPALPRPSRYGGRRTISGAAGLHHIMQRGGIQPWQSKALAEQERRC